MATLELDPLFVKALRLLHSRAKDSASQLRAMVEESIAARKSQKSSAPEGKSSSKQVSKEEDSKKREAEKREIDRLKQDISELGGSEPKKAKLEPACFLLAKEERKEREKEKEKEKEKARKEKERKEQEKEKERQEKERQKELEREKERERAKEKLKEVVSDDETEEEEDGGMAMDADDFAIGLGISCEVCRMFDVSSGNQLIECQECHALYHQECHKPPVTEQDVNDPRFVWYCNKCSKTVKKASQKPAKSKAAHSSSSKESASAAKASKSDPAPNPATFAFRRMDLKPSAVTTKESHSASTSSKPLSGFASLAANLSKPATSKSDTAKPFQPAWKADIAKPTSKDASKPSKEVKSEKGGSPSGAGSSGAAAAAAAAAVAAAKGSSGNGTKQATALSASSMASANMRIQKMKKNAAKQQEKRVHIK